MIGVCVKQLNPSLTPMIVKLDKSIVLVFALESILALFDGRVSDVFNIAQHHRAVCLDDDILAS